MESIMSLSVMGGPAIHLEPGTLYSIGRKAGLEFRIDDDSLELVHASIINFKHRPGVLSMRTISGEILVNGLERNPAVITKLDAIDGIIKLRFGKVDAEIIMMHQPMDSSEGEDTSDNSTTDSSSSEDLGGVI
ncbi:uncharacterized protein LOC111067007 [Drosophila obscura]|uniref:uncharacterized protein LOC111067007 n=1 Tax=Drosophila obscura TaxID=7282 RepID=UPI000B9FE873|nr:uncharacterized protein LOC111067007 [Drosophila obscura]